MNNNITPDMLIRYLDDELTAEERRQLETQLSTDAQAREQLEKLRLAKQAFGQYARRERVAAIHKEMMQERRNQPAKPGAKVRWLRTALRVAAIVILLVVIAGLVQYSLLDNDRLYRSHYQAYSLSTTRADQTSSALEEAYRRRRMRQVVELYRRSVTLGPADHFIAGQAFLATDDAENAVAAFEQQLAANEGLELKPYQDDAEYYLALAYLKSGNVDKALPLFEKINNQASHAYHREVSDWYLIQLQWLKRKQ